MSREHIGIPLEEFYKDDPGLLKLYKKKLLIKGWAGSMNDMERDYIRRMNPPWLVASQKAGNNAKSNLIPKVKKAA